MPKIIDTITKDEFTAYEMVRQDGQFNMVSRAAMDAAGLPKDKWMIILKHYPELMEKYKLED